ncbi:MAG: hypothetical protein QOI98_2241, partial [Solirubrobacteraceae bacterium]|nr:hypothetical protein [Solirubrobacteraceae bacterium]
MSCGPYRCVPLGCHEPSANHVPAK